MILVGQDVLRAKCGKTKCQRENVRDKSGGQNVRAKGGGQT